MESGHFYILWFSTDLSISSKFVEQVIDDVGGKYFHAQAVCHFLCLSLYPHVKGQDNREPK